MNDQRHPLVPAYEEETESAPSMSHQLFPTKYLWQDGSPVLATRLRRDGPGRYATSDGQYVVAKGPRLWYWENADDFSINSGAGFRTKREAVASLAEHMLREGLGVFVQRLTQEERAELDSIRAELDSIRTRSASNTDKGAQ